MNKWARPLALGSDLEGELADVDEHVKERGTVGARWTAGAVIGLLVAAMAFSPPPLHAREEKWLDEFPAHPRARLVCRQHVVGAGPGAPHIEWSLYATADAPGKVVTFYASARGVTTRRGATTLTISSSDGRKNLSMLPVGDARPDCGEEPDAQAKTVLVVSMLIAR